MLKLFLEIYYEKNPIITKKPLSTHTLLWGKQSSIDIMITQQPHLHWILHFMKKKHCSENCACGNPEILYE